MILTEFDNGIRSLIRNGADFFYRLNKIHSGLRLIFNLSLIYCQAPTSFAV
jgi:hypothetical protein